jgi:serine/threonine-protein kinase RsbW
VADSHPAPHDAEAIAYSGTEHLAAVRAFVRTRAPALGLTPGQTEMLALAVSELVTNTLQHTTGGGRVAVWADEKYLTCDVTDGGTARPFGRGMPAAHANGGRGLAIVERVSDEVTTFSTPGGTVVRVRFALKSG